MLKSTDQDIDMEISGHTSRRVLIGAVAALVVPLLFFPNQFGLQLARGGIIYLFYELVYYGFVGYLMQRQGNLASLAQFAGVCLIFRLAVGALFGVAVALLFSMRLSISLSLGLSSYLPTVLLHVVATPLILKPVLDDIVASRMPRRSARPSAAGDMTGTETTTPAASERTSMRKTISTPTVGDTAPSARHSTVPMSDLNGFERAVRYIGEHSAVTVAAVVDHEGLLLANYRRGKIEADEWAPLALVLFDANADLLSGTDTGQPDKIDLVMPDRRVIAIRGDSWALLVVADHHSDETLSIRCAQGVETISKYIRERYSRENEEEAKMERIHVSGA
jgi:predicted regulator of Ras-like GTPase activity (Roadblock/LC7/MglB family)